MEKVTQVIHSSWDRVVNILYTFSYFFYDDSLAQAWELNNNTYNVAALRSELRDGEGDADEQDDTMYSVVHP